MIAFRRPPFVLALAWVAPALAQPGVEDDRPVARENADGTVVVDGLPFESWGAYFDSDVFAANGRRCGTPSVAGDPLQGGSGEDCTLSFTNPDDVYDPGVVRYRIPVVVHVIRQDNGVTGHLSEATVRSQIEILNEDFLALPGTNGENGTDTQIEFFLATEDPDGDPTDGITYSNNTEWFNDDGNYWDFLAWDTSRYLNVYTNTASGFLGYVPALPQENIAGEPWDRVVCHYQAFGRDSPWVPFHLGRTAVHEVGHYFGLFHTFDGGCGGGSCYESGDLICDTNPESGPHFGCSPSSSCGSQDPIHNYMNYTDDPCMEEFTAEQARRGRCGLQHYRPDLYEIGFACAGDFDGDDVVGLDDMLRMLAAWGPCDRCPEDLDGDGDVGLGDLLRLLALWGPCPVVGACCLGDGACAVDTLATCVAAGGVYQGDGTVCLGSGCAPADDCADARAVTDGSYPFSTVTARTDGPLMPPECDEGGGPWFRADVWIRYVPPCDGVATVSVCDATYDTRLAVYESGACPGPLAACSDDACGAEGTRSELTFEARAGEEYLVRIGGRAAVGGEGVLVLECAGAGD